MSFTDENGNKCRCSRNRQCAFHAAQTKKMERVAKPMHDQQKVAEGIERLKHRYGPETARRDRVNGR